MLISIHPGSRSDPSRPRLGGTHDDPDLDPLSVLSDPPPIVGGDGVGPNVGVRVDVRREVGRGGHLFGNVDLTGERGQDFEVVHDGVFVAWITGLDGGLARCEGDRRWVLRSGVAIVCNMEGPMPSHDPPAPIHQAHLPTCSRPFLRSVQRPSWRIPERCHRPCWPTRRPP